MKRLGICAIVAGIVAGQTFNGPTTESFGVYLMLLAGFLLAVHALADGSSR